MKKFIYKLLAFSLLIVLAVLLILEMYGGYADYFYVKFTAPKAHAMILGDSRSFQGIQPAIIDANLSGFEKPMFNYSFTVAQISYGDAYLNSIKAKLDPNTKNGLFIISVHPFILAERDKDDFAKGIYFESEAPPHNMKYPSMNPNPEYFFKNFSYFHFKSIFRKMSYVHDDGWLEIQNIPIDSTTLKSMQADEQKLYLGFASKWKKSAYRLQKLEETIAYLKQHGTVVLLRMPVSSTILHIEAGFWTNFDADIEEICEKQKVAYLNYTKRPHHFEVFDGLHLNSKSGALFTKSLSDSIRLKVIQSQINK